MATDSRLPLFLVTLFFMGLAAKGTEAKVLALIHGVVPCSTSSTTTSAVFPNASVQLVVSKNDGISVPGTTTTTNNMGQFLIALNVTSEEELASLVRGGGSSKSSSSSKVVVTTPPAACDASLPAVGKLAAPVHLIASRRLDNSAMDIKQRLNRGLDRALDEAGRAINDLGNVLSGVIADVAVGGFATTTRGDRNLLAGLLGAGTAGDGDVDAFGVFGVGTFSYSAA